MSQTGVCGTGSRAAGLQERGAVRGAARAHRPSARRLPQDAADEERAQPREVARRLPGLAHALDHGRQRVQRWRPGSR